MRRYRRPARPAFSGPPQWLLPLALLAAMAGLVLLLRPLEPPVSGAAYAVDGDTLRLGSGRIRLLGIDALELEQPCTRANGAVWACGRVARDLLADTVRGAAVTCQPEGRDRYRRILAKCKSGDVDLGGLMVHRGMALGEFEYLAAEIAARARGEGIWSSTFVTPKEWRQLHPLIGESD
jgi:endonuclease YncB( thermonuclease family)